MKCWHCPECGRMVFTDDADTYLPNTICHCQDRLDRSGYVIQMTEILLKEIPYRTVPGKVERSNMEPRLSREEQRLAAIAFLRGSGNEYATFQDLNNPELNSGLPIQ